jgi:hypothetical protein
MSQEEKAALRHQVSLVIQGLRAPLADMSAAHARKLVRKALSKMGLS